MYMQSYTGYTARYLPVLLLVLLIGVIIGNFAGYTKASLFSVVAGFMIGFIYKRPAIITRGIRTDFFSRILSGIAMMILLPIAVLIGVVVFKVFFYISKLLLGLAILILVVAMLYIALRRISI